MARYFPTLTVYAQKLCRLLVLCVGAHAMVGVVTAESPLITDRIQVNRREKFEFESLPVERISIGIPEDYKPNLAKLPSGELLLVGFFAPNQGGIPAEYCFLYRSSDGGRTWSDRERIDILGREPFLSITSDGTLFISTHVLPSARGNNEGYTFCYLYRSADSGRTWEGFKIPYDAELRNARRDGKRLETAGVGTGRNVLELNDGTWVFAVGAPHGSALLWYSRDRGKTWDTRLAENYSGPDIAKYPYSIHNESYLWQVPCGDILAVKRVASKFYPPIANTEIPPSEIDHYERMVLYRSKDGGRNWSYEELGSHYGEMYPTLLRLQDGRLLFSFTMRSAVKPNHPPLGLRAVVGQEQEGRLHFDFQHDILMLDTKTPLEMVSGGGFGNTIQLEDGQLVSACSYRIADNTTRCEVIRWRLSE